jgi:hypothetical protein
LRKIAETDRVHSIDNQEREPRTNLLIEAAAVSSSVLNRDRLARRKAANALPQVHGQNRSDTNRDPWHYNSEVSLHRATITASTSREKSSPHAARQIES